MINKIEDRLVNIAKEKITVSDPSHDIYHTLRVLHNAKVILKKEGGDPDVVIPAALFHDIITYPKNDSKRHKSQEDSALLAKKILMDFKEYPKNKINQVKECILECSFTKNIMPKHLEGKIIQDADLLESTGAVSIMRTFSSAGVMNMRFYNPENPFCKNREPKTLDSALDLFYGRLLKASERMHTKTAKEIAKKRDKFLLEFLKELKSELN